VFKLSDDAAVQKDFLSFWDTAYVVLTQKSGPELSVFLNVSSI